MGAKELSRGICAFSALSRSAARPLRLVEDSSAPPPASRGRAHDRTRPTRCPPPALLGEVAPAKPENGGGRGTGTHRGRANQFDGLPESPADRPAQALWRFLTHPSDRERRVGKGLRRFLGYGRVRLISLNVSTVARKWPICFPKLEPILKETYGVIVYQEQVMKIASSLASYTMAEADKLRKAMGKKIAALMAKQRERFVKGAVGKRHR